MKTAPAILAEFVEALAKSASAAGQMIHHHQDPRWITIRDRLDGIKNRCVDIAVNAHHQVNHNVKH